MRSQQALRYRGTMKKSTRKLVLRSETIRAFRAMEILELARARAGDGAALLESTITQSGINCPIQVVRVPTNG